MSSETSTRSHTTVGADFQVGPKDDALQPWQLFTLAGLVGATVVVFMSRGQTPAAVILLSLTIFTAAAVGVAAWRTFAPIADEDEPISGHVVGGRTRATLERDKALVLRSIKELEFDRSMGKVSDKDFAEMSARLRGRAARLIRQLDAGVGYRDLIEKDLQTRLPSHGHQTTAPPVPVRTCTSCRTVNEGDARFCKHCGAGLEVTQ